MTKRIAMLTREMAGNGSFDRKYYFGKAYIEVLESLGATVWPILTEANIEEAVSFCDALLIPGSPSDVRPSYYGEEAMSGKTSYEIDEYALDRKTIDAFLAAGKKILGICAGLQELNVYFGGSLHQRIEGHCHDGKHPVRILPGSYIHQMYGSEERDVNTWHFQAIKCLGEGLKATAFAPDGTIEAIENEQVLGVQWHPEMLKDEAFFRWFLEKMI